MMGKSMDKCTLSKNELVMRICSKIIQIIGKMRGNQGTLQFVKLKMSYYEYLPKRPNFREH